MLAELDIGELSEQPDRTLLQVTGQAGPDVRVEGG
jgi:hypothetical protein